MRKVFPEDTINVKYRRKDSERLRFATPFLSAWKKVSKCGQKFDICDSFLVSSILVKNLTSVIAF